MCLAWVTYVVFALLATIGTWLAAAHFRGRRNAALWAAACLAFFVLLGAALGWAMSFFAP